MDFNDKLTTSLLKKSGGKNLRVVNIPKPQKTWFVQQVNGRIFACDESEAWSLTQNSNNNWTLRGNKFIGVSNGEVYVKGLIEASKITIEDLVKNKTKLKAMKQSQMVEIVNKAVKERMLKAFEDELAVARKNAQEHGIERPRNMSVLNINGQLQTNKKIMDSDFVGQ